MSNTLTKMVPVANLHANPDNPRFEAGDVTDIGNSITTDGLEEPLLVIPAPQYGDDHYMIEDGFLRWTASRLKGVEYLECNIRYPHPDEDLAQRALFIGLKTGIHKRELSAMEKAKAFGRLRDEFHLTQEQIGERLGVTGSTVSRYLMLLELSPKSQKAVRDKKLGVEKAIKAIQKHRATNRRKEGKRPVDVGWEPDPFNNTHPLARKANVICNALDHGSRRRFAGACHACWEAAIRQDQSTVIYAGLKEAGMPVPFVAPSFGNGAATGAANQIANHDLNGAKGAELRDRLHSYAQQDA